MCVFISVLYLNSFLEIERAKNPFIRQCIVHVYTAVCIIMYVMRAMMNDTILWCGLCGGIPASVNRTGRGGREKWSVKVCVCSSAWCGENGQTMYHRTVYSEINYYNSEILCEWRKPETSHWKPLSIRASRGPDK